MSDLTLALIVVFSLAIVVLASLVGGAVIMGIFLGF